MTTLAQFFGGTSGGGSAVYPPAGKVIDDAGDYGPNGDDYTPTYEETAASDVREGTTFGDGGGQTGTLVVSGGDYSDQLNRIEAQTALITAGRVKINLPVTEGGSLVLYKGSDYRTRNNTAIKIPVSDVGGSLRTLLKDGTKVASIIFGSGRCTETGEHYNEIVGTINPDDVAVDVEDSDVTNIFVEITKEQLTDATVAKHEYHIKAIAPVVGSEADGDEVVKIEGTLQLRHKRAEPET